MSEKEKSREQLLTELANQERLINKIFSSSVLSTWISDDKGTAIRVNKACLDFFGAEESEVLGQYNMLKDSVLQEAGHMEDLKKVFTEGKSVNIIVDYDFSSVDHVKVKKGTHKIINSIFTPIIDDGGRVTNVIESKLGQGSTFYFELPLNDN